LHKCIKHGLVVGKIKYIVKWNSSTSKMQEGGSNRSNQAKKGLQDKFIFGRVGTKYSFTRCQGAY
jgi:hypothetical protein